MKEVIKLLVEEAKKDRKLLQDLKHVAVRNLKYEIAAGLREIETDLFPDAKTTSKEYKEAESFSTILKIAGLDTSTRVAYLALNLSREFINGEKGSFDIRKAQEIVDNADNIFGTQ